MRLLLFSFFLSLASLAQATPLPQLRGDAEATARIERMLDRMGGRERWAAAKSYYIRIASFIRARVSGKVKSGPGVT